MRENIALHDLLEPGAALPQFSSQASQAAVLSIAISMRRIADHVCGNAEKAGLVDMIWLAADLAKS